MSMRYRQANQEHGQLPGSEQRVTAATEPHRSLLRYWQHHVDSAEPSGSLHTAQTPSQQSVWPCYTHHDQDTQQLLTPLHNTDETMMRW